MEGCPPPPSLPHFMPDTFFYPDTIRLLDPSQIVTSGFSPWVL